MKNDFFEISRLFGNIPAELSELFGKIKYPWEALSQLKDFLENTVKERPFGFVKIGEKIIAQEGVKIEEGTTILGPTVICAGAEIRQGAYIRGGVFIGEGACVGHCTEIKNSILMHHAKAPHFNYVGDSILGFGTHLGAGAILSNLKADKTSVKIEIPPLKRQENRDGKDEITELQKCQNEDGENEKKGEKRGTKNKNTDAQKHYDKSKTGDEKIAFDTSMRKLGAIIGDGAEIGCNAVLNPGSIIGKGSRIYPLTNWRGTLENGKIAKSKDEIFDLKA